MAFGRIEITQGEVQAVTDFIGGDDCPEWGQPHQRLTHFAISKVVSRSWVEI